MGVVSWALDRIANAEADPAIPAQDGASARSFAGMVRGIMAGVRAYADDQGGALVTGGMLNAYAVRTASGVKKLRAGLSLTVQIDRTNTGPVTLNVDGTGPKPWRDGDVVDFAPGALVAGRFGRVTWDAAHEVWITEDASVLAGKVSTVRVIATSGLATGGGNLTLDRTITVAKATQEQAEAAADDTTALTPARGFDLVKAQAPLILQADLNAAARKANNLSDLSDVMAAQENLRLGPTVTSVFHAANYGIRPDVDLGPDLDTYLNFVWNNGGRAAFGVGEYIVSQTGKIRPLAIISGEGNAGVTTSGLLRRGGTVFKATSALRASGGAVLETLNFASNTGTQTKMVTEPTMTWGFELSEFAIDRGWDRNFANAATAADKGRGLNLYGRRYKVRDVGIYNCEGIGFYTECGNPTSPPAGWFNDYRNNQDGIIERVDIQLTAYEGFVTLGPGDTFINYVTVGLVGDTSASVYPLGTALNSLLFPGERITNFVMAASAATGASGTHEIGTIHAHTNWSGWAFRAKGDGSRLIRLKAENLIAESALGSVFLQAGVFAQISKINTRNNIVRSQTAGDTQFADVRLGSTFEVDIGSIEGRKSGPSGANPGLTGVRIEQDNVQIGIVKYQGNTLGGHAVTVEDNKRRIFIGSLLGRGCRGPAQDGQPSAALYTKTGCDEVTVGNLMSDLSDYGWRNASTQKVAVLAGHASVSSASTDFYGAATNVAGIQLDNTPGNLYIRNSKLTTTTLAGVVLKPSCETIVTAATAGLTDPSIVQSNVAGLTVAHGMWRIPDWQREPDISIKHNGTMPTVPPNIQPTGADATNVIFKYSQSAAASGASNTGTVFTMRV